MSMSTKDFVDIDCIFSSFLTAVKKDAVKRCRQCLKKDAVHFDKKRYNSLFQKKNDEE